MKKSRLWCALVACLLIGTVNAATIIDFEGATTNLNQIQSYGGYQFEFTAANFGIFEEGYYWGVPSLWAPAENGTTRLVVHGDEDIDARPLVTGRVTMSKIGGGLFDLVAFDTFTTYTPGGSSGPFTVTGYYEDGSSSEVDLNITGSQTTFHLGSQFEGLESIVFSDPNSTFLSVQNALGFELDNISVSAVPIPPALYLFGSGLLGLVGVVRRKRLIGS